MQIEEDTAPLTRIKGQKIEETRAEEVTEPVIINSKAIEKPVKPKKPRAPKTPAQLEAFKKASETRKKNIEVKKAKQTLEAQEVLTKYEGAVKAQPKPRAKAKTQVVEEESDDEPQIIYIKKKKRAKKKIIVQSESSESESEPEIEIKHRKSFGVSHQNKSSVKSITKIEPIKRSHHNFFVD